MFTRIEWLIVGFAVVAMSACGDTTETDDTAATTADAPTYYEHVQPILESSCSSCHSPGNIGPFNFGTYAEAFEYGTLIQSSVNSKRMPPMPPDTENCRPLDDERVMTDEQRATVLAWIDGGMPEGDPSLAAAASSESALTAEDSLGSPTSTVTWGYDFPSTPDLYEEWRCLIVDPGWEEPVHLRAVGVGIDNPAVVHHIIQMLVLPGNDNAIQALEDEDDIPGWWCPNGSRIDGTFSIGGYAPGAQNRPFPDGSTITLPAGSKIIMQMHYNYATARGVDQSQTLFWEVDEPSDKRPRGLTLVNQWFEIPEGAVSYTAEGFSTIQEGEGIPTGLSPLSTGEGWAWGASAHLHARGKEVRIDRISPDGTEECMLHIPNWDFNWQGSYRFKEPMALYNGDVIRIRCTWDNSYDNQPIGWDGAQQESRDIGWGDGTFDEMCLGNLQLTDFD